jgi:hypothetical protein
MQKHEDFQLRMDNGYIIYHNGTKTLPWFHY